MEFASDVVDMAHYCKFFKSPQYNKLKKKKYCDKTASNEHIAKIAALPRVDKKSVFLRSLLALIKCWDAATSAICHHVNCKRGTAQWDNDKKMRKEQ